MNKLILRFTLLFSPLFNRFGVNTDQLEIILSTKLLMDERRPSVFNSRKKAQESKDTPVWVTMLVTSLIGAGLAFLLFISPAPLVGHTIYFSAFMVFLTITLISDFTNVLIDVRDNYIILPKPVSDATLTVARILHIAIYLMKMVLALSLAGLAFVSIKDGTWAALVFLVQVILASVISIFLVNMIYLLVLKLSSPQRFKDIIAYFQIFFAVIVFGAYRLLPNLVTRLSLRNVHLLSVKAIWLLPPVWIASLNEIAVHPSQANNIVVLLAVLAFAMPVVFLFLVVKVLAPGFNQKLAMISGSSGERPVAEQKVKTLPLSLMARISNILAPDALENAGFRFTWLLSSRLREFKVKAYPSFAYLPVYIAYFALTSKNRGVSIHQAYGNLASGKAYVVFAYLCSFVIMVVTQHISQTEKYKSSWIFYTTPVEKPGRILAGMFKAIIAKFFVPLYLVIAFVEIYIWGFNVVNDLLLAFCISVIYANITALFLVKRLPFTQPVVAKQAAGKTFLSLFLLIIPLALAGGHYFLSSYESVIWVCVFVFAAIEVIIFQNYKNQTWDNIELEEV